MIPLESMFFCSCFRVYGVSDWLVLSFFLVAPTFPPHRFKEWLSVHALASVSCNIYPPPPTNVIPNSHHLYHLFKSVSLSTPGILHIPQLGLIFDIFQLFFFLPLFLLSLGHPYFLLFLCYHLLISCVRR